MKITFTRRHWWDGIHTREIHIQTNTSGYWTRHSQRKILEALKATKGIEVEE